LKALPPDPMVRIIFHDHNQGKGAAVRTGFREARGDIFLIQDADLEYDRAITRSCSSLSKKAARR